MARRQEQWPSGIKFLCVHCDASSEGSSLMATDDAQEALAQTTRKKPKESSD